MSDVTTVLEANRAAMADFMAATDQSASVWTKPRAPKKWSPSQVTEHVACTMEEGAKVVSGTASVFPTVPGLLRPLVRGLFEEACRGREASGLAVEHPVFGTVSVVDYAKFMELHTHHHRKQMPGAA